MSELEPGASLAAALPTTVLPATVLIVDDTPTNLMVLLETLEEAGYDVLVAKSGAQALERARLGSPDLILLDVVMPEMNGFETCRRLKATPGLDAVPVIFMTALSHTDDKLSGFDAGAVDYITKPLDHDEVLARVRTHLTIRKLQQTLESQNFQLRAITDSLTNFLRTDRSQEASKLLLESAISHVDAQFAFVGVYESGRGPAAVRVQAIAGHIDEQVAQFRFFAAMRKAIVEDGSAEYPITALHSHIGPILDDSPGHSSAKSQSSDQPDAVAGFLNAPIVENGEVGGFLCIAKPGALFTAPQRSAATRFAQASGVIFECERLRQQQAEAQFHRLQAEEDAQYLREEIRTRHNFEEVIGQSDGLRRVLEQVERVAATDSTVLIRGETGTGKELIARAVHNASRRQSRPLVSVSCASFPESLIESELFGHERGAFTGADKQRKGRFELANGGTLFLDEIGEMSPSAQTKLLRVLQEREFERVGGSETIEVDVRVLAATHRDLQAMVAASDFREDLYYRLNVFPIELPPLRERVEDIPALAEFFMARFVTNMGWRISSISSSAIEQLCRYSWPGNVRELENIIERCVILSVGHPEGRLVVPPGLLSDEAGVDVVGVGRQTPAAVTDPSAAALDAEPVLQVDHVDAVVQTAADVRRTLAEVERDYIVEILHSTNWVIQGANGAAAILDLKPSTLRNRMLKLAIEKTE